MKWYRNLIIEKIWNIDQVVTSNNVDVLVKLLRSKLKAIRASLKLKIYVILDIN